jgi:NAD(P)-dependent dehydrogenase (short-subunit alcohol dehydrogenase family)
MSPREIGGFCFSRLDVFASPLALIHLSFGWREFGTIIMTKAAIPVMREQRSGHIIQFSSVGGRIA